MMPPINQRKSTLGGQGVSPCPPFSNAHPRSASRQVSVWGPFSFYRRAPVIRFVGIPTASSTLGCSLQGQPGPSDISNNGMGVGFTVFLCLLPSWLYRYTYMYIRIFKSLVLLVLCVAVGHGHYIAIWSVQYQCCWYYIPSLNYKLSLEELIPKWATTPYIDMDVGFIVFLGYILSRWGQEPQRPTFGRLAIRKLGWINFNDPLKLSPKN